jgi:hypothetical protein
VVTAAGHAKLIARVSVVHQHQLLIIELHFHGYNIPCDWLVWKPSITKLGRRSHCGMQAWSTLCVLWRASPSCLLCLAGRGSPTYARLTAQEAQSAAKQESSRARARAPIRTSHLSRCLALTVWYSLLHTLPSLRDYCALLIYTTQASF